MAYLAELDTRLLLYIQDALRYEPLHSFWRGISFLGDLGWFWIFTGILLTLNSKTRTAGITAIAALVLSTFISNVILKNAVMRPRPFEVLPQIIPLITHASGYSFPSGHTASAFAAAFALWLQNRMFWAALLRPGLAVCLQLNRCTASNKIKMPLRRLFLFWLPLSKILYTILFFIIFLI